MLNNSIIKSLSLTLSTGFYATATFLNTPDNRFMLKDGSYKEARHLTLQYSLMPFYEKNDGGYVDILLNDGKRIQVRTKHVFSTGNCSYFRFAFKLEENCDFFVLWGITPKSNYFYIVPRKDILGKTSLNIKLRNTLSGLEYLDKWEYLK